LCRTSVSLLALSNKVESRECNASEAYALGRNNDAVNGRGIGQNRLDVSKINSRRNRTGAIVNALFPEMNETFAIKTWKSQSSKSSLKEGKARAL
jgi:hypothetical protein